MHEGGVDATRSNMALSVGVSLRKCSFWAKRVFGEIFRFALHHATSTLEHIAGNRLDAFDVHIASGIRLT